VIPISFRRRINSPSPAEAERDLSLLIHQTVEAAVAAHHELGYAARNVGCDGRVRTTMFDGSTCQTDGDVCLATRQDGITACIEAPANGAGLDFRAVAFAGAECVAATGWFCLDSAGYLYRIPQSAIDVAPYWPVTEASPGGQLVLLRAGKWSKLMCGADLVLVTNDGGGAEWINVGEPPGVWTQKFLALVGGDEDGWLGVDPELPYIGVLWRDVLAPNVGSRAALVTFTGAPAEIAAEATVAYGYPFARVLGTGVSTPSSLAPFPRTAYAGTWQADCVGRVAGDMALCYSRRLAVAYSRTHVCLAGDDIPDPSDFVSASEIGQSTGPALDVAADVLALPGGEIALMGPTDLRIGTRWRVRPAPAAAPTATATQLAKGVWGSDPNPWVWETDYAVEAWGYGATTFTVVEDLTAPEAPGRGVDVVLWEGGSGIDSWRDATVKYFGTLGETSGGVTPIGFVDGTVVVASTSWRRRLTVLGAHPSAVYGWTAEDEDGRETALSPLLRDVGVPSGPLYSVEVEMPGGPTGTTKRHLYRFAFDTLTEAPWEYSAYGAIVGAVYDRMMRRVLTYDSTAPGATAGTDPVTVYDEDTDLTNHGTRPPLPLIGPLGTVSVEAPLPLHLTQPTQY